MISRTFPANGSGSGPGRSGWVTSVRSGRTGTVPLVPLIVDIVSGGLPEAEAESKAVGQLRSQLAPADQRNVLRGGNQGLKPGDIEIQVPMVQVLQQPLLRQVAELVEIHHVAGVRIDLPFYRELQLVVVPMVVGIAAVAEGGSIPRLREVRIIQPVGGVEVDGASDGATGHGWRAASWELGASSEPQAGVGREATYQAFITGKLV